MITHLGGLLLISDKFCVMVHCIGTMWSVMQNIKIVSFCIQRPMVCIIIIYVVSPSRSGHSIGWPSWLSIFFSIYPPTISFILFIITYLAPVLLLYQPTSLSAKCSKTLKGNAVQIMSMQYRKNSKPECSAPVFQDRPI